MKRVMLYFGSFNPVHRGHIALAEYVVGQGLCDEAVLVVSPQSPYKQAAELAPEMDRFEMAEIACAASKYPERIKPSVVEFLLPKPSYTIDTLRYLKENFGSGMQFSILIGSDQIARLAGWKEYEQILEYPVYVYPRRGEPAEGFEGRITPLTDAPLQDFASTDVRDRIGRGEDVAAMLDEGVAAYIRRKGLWSPATRIAALGAQIVAELGMPLFVKPNANGSSFGVTKVHAPEELPAAIEAAFAQGDEILIEECITGREMGCGMLVAGGREYVFPITEIVSKKDFFDYEAKYTAGFSDEITPADITPEVKAELNRMTREAYRTCRCSGVVRVDFIVTPAGVPYFIELNSIPGMSRGSIVPKQAREMGMSLGELYDIIIADTCRK